MASNSLKRKAEAAAKSAAQEVNQAIKNCEYINLPQGHERKGRGLALRGGTEIIGVNIETTKVVLPGKCVHITYLTKAEHSHTNSKTCEDYKIDTFTVKHSNGMAAIVVLNDEYIVINKTYRFPIEMFLWNMPRCFTFEYGPSEEQVDEFLGNHKYQWMSDIATFESYEHIGSYFQDSGSDATEVQLYIIRISYDGDIEELKSTVKKDYIKFNFLKPKEIEDMIGGGNFKESHDITSWYLAKNALMKKGERLVKN